MKEKNNIMQDDITDEEIQTFLQSHKEDPIPMSPRHRAPGPRRREVMKTPPSPIQQIFQYAWSAFCEGRTLTNVQWAAGSCILDCRTERAGYSRDECSLCGYQRIHYNSCRNRSCPRCQGLKKEEWLDKRNSEMIDAPYFHIVFTLPAELNPIMYANQDTLYPFLHKSAAQTVLELAADPKFLGAVPGLVQILHTWGQKLNYHPHIHMLASGAGLTQNGELKLSSNGEDFFIPAKVLAAKFRGKFLAGLKEFYDNLELVIPPSCENLINIPDWKAFIDRLYRKQWCPEIKRTCNGKGDAIQYFGRYAYRVAITDSRILKVTPDSVTFKAKDYKKEKDTTVTLTLVEFIRRFMQHVLPKGFQKIRYYGFLNNRYRKANLEKIFKIQGGRKHVQKLEGLSVPAKLKQLFGLDVTLCPLCGNHTMRNVWRSKKRVVALE